MRAHQLAILVERHVPRIPEPDPGLEQYTTPGELAAMLALTAARSMPPGARAADLGAGTCRLAAALALAGFEEIVAVEGDPRLPPLCRAGLEELGVDDRVGVVNAWITGSQGPLAPGSVDLVVMNPPFGVQRRGADRVFLEYAFHLRPARVYAILKSGNESFHRRLAEGAGYALRVLSREWFPLPATMAHHRSRMRRVLVDVVELTRIR